MHHGLVHEDQDLLAGWSCLEGLCALASQVVLSFRISWNHCFKPWTWGCLLLWSVPLPDTWWASFPSDTETWTHPYFFSCFSPLFSDLQFFILSGETMTLFLIYVHISASVIPIHDTLAVGGFRIKPRMSSLSEATGVSPHQEEKSLSIFCGLICVFIQNLWESSSYDQYSALYMWD